MKSGFWIIGLLSLGILGFQQNSKTTEGQSKLETYAQTTEIPDG